MYEAHESPFLTLPSGVVVYAEEVPYEGSPR